MRAEVPQESPKNQEKSVKIGLVRGLLRALKGLGCSCHRATGLRGNCTPVERLGGGTRAASAGRPGGGASATASYTAEKIGPSGTQWSLLIGFTISDLQDPSPSQILGTSSRFSEDFLGRERPQGGSPRVREDPLGTSPLSLPRKSLRTSRRSRESRK